MEDKKNAFFFFQSSVFLFWITQSHETWIIMFCLYLDFL